MSMQSSAFMLADPSKCSGCRACELACFAAHQAVPAKTIGAITHPVMPRLFLARSASSCMPVQCHHCEEAPCIHSCLTGALSREDGVVLLDRRRCIGCRNCLLACPFGALEITSGKEAAAADEGAPQSVYKCDLCKDNGYQAACAAACPNQAIRYVDVTAALAAKRENALNAHENLNAVTRTEKGEER